MRGLAHWLAIVALFPGFAYAGFCDTAWNGDVLVSGFYGKPASGRVSLLDENKNPKAIVTVEQVRVFHNAKERISQTTSLHPIFVICADQAPNAFAVPTERGGVVGVTVGMLRVVDGDPDMAAAVIGHEFGHHTAGHNETAAQRNALIGIAGLAAAFVLEREALRGSKVRGLGINVARIGTVLVARQFDRDQEREADDLGFRYMTQAGFNPSGAVRIADKFQKMGGSEGGSFFSSHPGWDERADRFRAMIASSSGIERSSSQVASTPENRESQVEVPDTTTRETVAKTHGAAGATLQDETTNREQEEALPQSTVSPSSRPSVNVRTPRLLETVSCVLPDGVRITTTRISCIQQNLLQGRQLPE